jgi:hypothetical protein
MTSRAGAERWQLDESLDWGEHYLRYGFCRLRGLIEAEAVDAALTEVRELVGDPRPLEEWTADRPGQRYSVHYAGELPALDALLESPRLHAALERFFGSLGFGFGSSEPDDPDRRRLALWLNPFDPDALPRLHGRGHIDSGRPDRGVAIHVALAASEPFSGNTTYVPGSHLTLQRWLQEHPDPQWPGGTYPEVTRELAPWEFVAEAGDVVFAHHLLFHSGNPSHAVERRPRIAIRQEVFPGRAAEGGGSLFERSLG